MNDYRMNRRRVLASAAIGAGILATGGREAAAALVSGPQDAEEIDVQGQWVSWDDGYLYPITAVDDNGHWIIVQDEADPEAQRYAVNPAGWVYDNKVWYRLHDTDADGVWFDGDDDYVYLALLD